MSWLSRPRQAVCPGLLWLACAAPLVASEQPSDLSRGEQVRDSYFRRETQSLADACLADIKTKEDWERKRPELRRQFLEMMGLWPLPSRTDLRPVVTGKVDTERFSIEKLHFQSSPGLYVTADLYVPKLTLFPAPAVLYLCGHGNTVLDKVSYGSKVNYQHHPIYAALFEPDVARLDLWYPPQSHHYGPIFLNVRTLLDLPQAVALAFPKPIRIYVKDNAEAKAWEWAVQLQSALGQESLKIRQVGN